MNLIAHGTVTADGTEQVLSTQTPSVPKWYVLKVSVVNMLSGDTLELRTYSKMEGSAFELAGDVGTFTDAQTGGLQPRSLPVPIAGDASQQYKASLKQTTGTNRTYKWELYEF